MSTMNDPGIERIFAVYKPGTIRLVGGCVRDFILGKNVHDLRPALKKNEGSFKSGNGYDIDFASIYTPEESMSILDKAGIKHFDTGSRFGTITAHLYHKNYEITTLRKDISSDGRKANVLFTKNWEEDSKRRDFTFNALYMDHNGQIYDYHNGISDLKTKKIKFIGDAAKRIQEDYLRILRFFRFVMQLSCSFDPEALEAIKQNNEGIKQLSSERIYQEFSKILVLSNFNSHGKIFAENVLKVLDNQIDISDLLAFKEGGSYTQRFIIMCRANAKQITKWHSILKHSASLKASISEVISMLNMIKNSNYHELVIADLAHPNILKEAKDIASFYGRITKDFELKLYNYIEIHDKIPDFPLSGADLLANGFTEGKIIGVYLKKAKIIWIDSQFTIDKKNLLQEIIKLLASKDQNSLY